MTPSHFTRLLTLSVLLAGGVLFANDPKNDAGQPAEQYELPKDPKAVVISLDFQGGFTPPRLKQEPTMSILTDGTVNIPANYQGQKPHEGKLSEGQIQALLRFIIKDNEFFKYDEQEVQAAIQKQQQQQGGLQIAVADAPTTVINVNADGKTKEVRRYALGMGQKVKQLEQLQAVQQRLMRVRSVVELGGEKQVAQWLKQANEQLKAQFPKVKPLTEDDLRSGGTAGDGRVYINFSRTVLDEDDKPRSITSVTINKPADGEKQITVVHRDDL